VRSEYDFIISQMGIDEVRGDNRLRLPDIQTAEQKQPVEVRDVDGVHIDDINVPKPGKRKRLQQLALKAPRPNHQDPGSTDDPRRPAQRQVCERTAVREDGFDTRQHHCLWICDAAAGCAFFRLAQRGMIINRDNRIFPD
jgi:hypothetical protein